VNPNVDVESNIVRIDEGNASSVFSGCSIVVEAFDGAESKAMLINTLLSYPGFRVVSGNGVAGFGPANEIITTEPMDCLVMCGDSRTEAGPGCGLTAAHVMVAASHQANAVIRLILGLPVL
jgi:sulfur carrier protein ThiS adenylyltransferase